MTALHERTARDLVRALHAGEVGAAELVDAHLARAEDDRWGSFLAIDAERARARAAEIDAMPERPPLGGVPIAIKDALSTRDLTTTAGSRILEGFRPLYTATCVERLERAGAIVIGKTNMDEFAMGSSTENSAFQPTRNPWDPGRVPGGSSGGSAAAVAAFQAPWALGSDTGGSIRQPAALCGIVGMKPTYGAVSRYGLIAFASSLDQVGPFTRTVGDAALLLSHIVGRDERDSTSLDWPEPVAVPSAEDLRGLTFGVVGELMGEGVEPGVRAAVEAAVARVEELGGSVREVSLPSSAYGVSTYYLIAPAECSANLARFDGIRYGPRHEDAADLLEHYERTRGDGFGPEVKRRVMLGTFALASGYYDAYYLRAQKVRTLIRRDFDAAFAETDFLLSPTSPTVAFRFGERIEDPLSMYLSDVCTIPVSLAGLPAISIPCGLSEGLPVGLQIAGPAFSENRLLDVAHALEGALAFAPAPPGVA
ncbi:Asp-tRNA(Asn)/Glu-tRNA(Gln) amidotransferase subunit GatA [Miltoncostaea marina]|uniref:Asp-tRNA(Asn)/Glu-tRNA(Gln) amidotransferase subunit GatA n=1 Tax=Miltoncostaea marina TaxID=2843215 RepID=UPI001C3E501F|nr:Asp-tRNA(Asn)/Glu-tRNA(Gln) amidotransferase subunit GatA [Miltoncostaea marina]